MLRSYGKIPAFGKPNALRAVTWIMWQSFGLTRPLSYTKHINLHTKALKNGQVIGGNLIMRSLKEAFHQPLKK